MTILDILTDNQKEQLYLDWINNFITAKQYAVYHKIDEELALDIIEQGRIVNHKRGV